MRRYLWYRKRRIYGRRLNALLIFLLLFFLLGCINTYFNKVSAPAVKAITEVRARGQATQAIHSSVNEVFESGYDYDDLITLRKDEKGKITAIQSNIREMNRIASEVALKAQQKLSMLEYENISIPFGVFAGFGIFSARGPDVPVRVKPVGNAEVSFRSEFSEAGINQTRHRIYADVTCRIRIAVPLIEDMQEVTASVPVAETVIVGDVPGMYVNIRGDG